MLSCPLLATEEMLVLQQQKLEEERGRPFVHLRMVSPLLGKAWILKRIMHQRLVLFKKSLKLSEKMKRFHYILSNYEINFKKKKYACYTPFTTGRNLLNTNFNISRHFFLNFFLFFVTHRTLTLSQSLSKGSNLFLAVLILLSDVAATEIFSTVLI